MLENKIAEQLNAALKKGQKVKVSVLRMLISELKNKKIADRVKELEDDKVIALIQKTVRKHMESIDTFKQGGREDLVEKETQEMSVLEEYLPEQMSEEDIRKVVLEVIEETGASSVRDMGQVIKAVLEKLQGSADGKVVSSIVKEKLGQ